MKQDDLIVVGIGASAGGLEAIERFFASAPESDLVAYVIVQHLSPDHKSLMGELLARHTGLPITSVTDGMEIQPASIYLMPRKSNITVFNGRLFLTEPEPGLNLPIDTFLRTLSEDYGERAIGVILSGTGSDGTRGVRAIKEAGGLVFVQEESTARFDGMPGSANRTGIVDFVLPPEEMPERILQFARSQDEQRRQDGPTRLPSSGVISRILMLIRKRTGVDLSGYKETTIQRRIERRIGITLAASVEDYLQILNEQPDEVTTLFKEILIGVTKFFRDPEAFDALQELAIPQIVNSSDPREPIRVWVSGCSTGEEAYSLAILFAEYLERTKTNRQVRVFATDIDREAIQAASEGVYPESIAADASPERLRRYFVRKGESYRIAPEIRQMVIFAYHNVFNDPPFRRINLVSCRNLLIYLQPSLQGRVLSNFAFSLDVGGFLLLGSSETIGEFSRYFEPTEVRWKLFRSTEHRPRSDGERDLSIAEPGLPRSTIGFPMRRWTREASLEEVYGRLLESVLPPSVIVNEDRSVERVFGDISPYLQLTPGRVDLTVTKLAREPISIALGNALQLAMRQNRPVVTNRLALTVDGEDHGVAISIAPIQTSVSYLYHVSFDAGELLPDAVRAEFDVDASVRQRIRDLETELQHSQENLQATIEELETSNEELQATNEELLSSNEELQSTNEELQSVNEELVTVNAEYQKKIEELSELNDDMDNLLAATPVGTIFLDRELQIRKFTPAAAEQFNLIRSDLGRNFSDLTHRLDYDELLRDVARVMEGREQVVREVRANDGRWYVVRVLPYSDGERQSGVLIALVDVSRRRAAESLGDRQNLVLMNVLESNPLPTVMINRDGAVGYANDSCRELLGDHLTSLEFPIAQMHASPGPIEGYRAVVSNDDHEHRLRLNGTPLVDDDGALTGAIFIIIED